MFFKVLRINVAIAFILFLLFVFPSLAIEMRSAKINLPPQASLVVPPGVTATTDSNGETQFSYDPNIVFPLEIKITDLFGATVSYQINEPDDFEKVKASEDYILDPHANPIQIYTLPKLCPRIEIQKRAEDKIAVYDANLDILNEKPKAQIFDPDFKTIPAQKNLLKHFDDKNVLLITRAKVLYDYEDSTIVDYQGPNPITKKPQLVYEGEGGFYANFHYAVVPYDERILKLPRQELLNLAQGKLAYIGRNDLQPSLRTHSFLPGPYESKDGMYAMCEWGDTMFIARNQQLYYKDFKIWDWDLHCDCATLRPCDCANQKELQDRKVAWSQSRTVIIIVWEGDEEDWLIADGLLDPFYLTDDVVGVFVVNYEQTLTPLTLKNDAGNFEMDVVTRP